MVGGAAVGIRTVSIHLVSPAWRNQITRLLEANHIRLIPLELAILPTLSARSTPLP